MRCGKIRVLPGNHAGRPKKGHLSKIPKKNLYRGDGKREISSVTFKIWLLIKDEKPYFDRTILFLLHPPLPRTDQNFLL